MTKEKFCCNCMHWDGPGYWAGYCTLRHWATRPRETCTEFRPYPKIVKI